MSPEHAARLVALVHGRKAAALGTLHGGAPFVSMAPYALLRDASAFIIHVSRLSGHTKDMLADPRVSLLVMQEVAEGGAPQALARVSVQGQARELAKGSDEEGAARLAYLARFPEAVALTAFSDFSFFAIRPVRARFVAGFAQAMSVEGDTLARVLASP